MCERVQQFYLFLRNFRSYFPSLTEPTNPRAKMPSLVPAPRHVAVAEDHSETCQLLELGAPQAGKVPKKAELRQTLRTLW